MELQSMATAPKDGSSVRVQERSGYTHAFYQDGFWWWHTVNGDIDGDYACGPVPEGWYAPNVERNRPVGGFSPEGPVHGSVGRQRTEGSDV